MSSNIIYIVAAFGTGQIFSRLKRIQAKERGRVEAAHIKCWDGTEVIPYVPPTRSEQIKSLKEDLFDVLVVGGGCVGSGVALDASKRGFKTAMVEADDFGAGTTGRSTKLIHGGIRYLETAFKKLDLESYRLVEEALEERAYMLQAAPYMNHPLPIMIPVYTWWELPYMWLGTKVYDWLAGSRLVVPPSHFMSRAEAIYNFPKLKDEGLKGAIIYYDGQMNDTRLSLVIALTATQQGACIANRVKVTGLVKDDDTGQVKGAAVRDEMTGEEWQIDAKAVINATGCFCDSIRKMDNPEARDLVVPASGVHIMLPAHFSPSTMGLIVPKTSDGRVLFVMPWEGATLVGTTDTASELTMLPKPTDEEVNFIIQESNRYLSHRVHRSDVIAAWSGLRPLVTDPKRMDEEGTKALSRNHVIEVSDSKLVTVTGGKWTTFRRMAEETVNATQASIPNLDEENAVSTTAKTALGSLIGADRAGVVCARKFDEINVTLREEYSLSDDVAKHLVGNYGTRALQIAEIVRRNQDYANTTDAAWRLSAKYPYLEAEVVFVVEQEYAIKAVDVLARRTRLAFVDSKAAAEAAPRVVEIMAELLEWSRPRRRQELLEVEEFLKTMAPNSKGMSRRRKRR